MTCSWRSLPSGVSRICRHGSAAAGSSRPLRSWPAEKCLPLAARITTRTASSASARSNATDSSSSIAVDWALAASARFKVTVATAPSTSYKTTSATGQSQHAFADDVALDLVGAREDRRRLVVEPRALPRAVTGIVGRTPPEGGGRTQHGHRRLVQAFAHLAPVQLECRPLRPRLQTLLHPGQRAPVVELEQLHLHERLGEALAQAPVVPRTGLRRQPEQLVEQLQVNDQLAWVDA